MYLMITYTFTLEICKKSSFGSDNTRVTEAQSMCSHQHAVHSLHRDRRDGVRHYILMG